VIVFTTNHPERFDSRFLDRCEVVHFESQAALVDVGSLHLHHGRLLDRRPLARVSGAPRWQATGILVSRMSGERNATNLRLIE
jgi:hypothetical protein